jgi:hypothetical protein
MNGGKKKNNYKKQSNIEEMIRFLEVKNESQQKWVNTKTTGRKI